MASQRRMAVFPKCAGMFFMSVIIGGSGRDTSRRRKNKAISIRQHVWERFSRVRARESPWPFPREETELRFMNSCILMMYGKRDLHVYQ